jgi:hypothetical protein
MRQLKIPKKSGGHRIVIGGSSPGDLAQVCQQHWCIKDLSLGSAAVEGVLSI